MGRRKKQNEEDLDRLEAYDEEFDEIDDEFQDDYNETDVIDYAEVSDVQEQIMEKISELKVLCNFNKIPMFIALGIEHDNNGIFQIKADKNYAEGGEITAFAILPEIMELNTKDRRFADFVNVVNGYTTILKPEPEINEEDFNF